MIVFFTASEKLFLCASKRIKLLRREFENDVRNLRNQFISPFIENSQIENFPDAWWSSEIKFSNNNIYSKDFQRDFVGFETQNLASHTRGMVPDTRKCNIWIYTLNCGDWYPLDLDTFGNFLTKTTITFVALINPNF